MRPSILVREYARLTTEVVAPSLDCATVPDSAFEWLCSQQAQVSTRGARLAIVEGRRWLQLDNYVGLVTTPCGTTIEILPKHASSGDDPAQLRRLLIRMISGALDLKPRTFGPAELALFRYPLSEWVLWRYLDELDRLVTRGMRFEYRNVHEENRYIRGRLDLGRQVRQPPGRRHLFHIQHDLYTPDRPENRLLKLALGRARALTRQPNSWRLANELLQYLEPIPESTNVKGDLAKWRNERLLSHYQAVRPWCELLLSQMNPTAQSGDWQGMSLLFPMEKLFERFVASALARHIRPGATLTSQPMQHALCKHQGQRWFYLQPDLLIRDAGPDGKSVVLDTKWKRLDASKGNSEDKYDLSQGDFYQLFAYGQRYLNGAGDLFLIYPLTPLFQKCLPAFAFSSGMRLWVVPFDLETETLIPGDWSNGANWYANAESIKIAQPAESAV
jgi:5-methylcytosine-specific restriction enzyme subunit McrC